MIARLPSIGRHKRPRAAVASSSGPQAGLGSSAIFQRSWVRCPLGALLGAVPPGRRIGCRPLPRTWDRSSTTYHLRSRQLQVCGAAVSATVVPIRHTDVVATTLATDPAAAAVRATSFPRIRWMGSKYKLLPHLARAFDDVGGSTALDAFSGSGVVSYLLKHQGYAVHANDYLSFPGVIAQAGVVNQDALLSDEDVERITGPSGDDRDFIRRTFTGVYFTPDDLGFLDSAWSHIAVMDGNHRALAIAAICLAAARKQPRGVFTLSGDLSRYDDGRRDLKLSLREHFVERAAEYNAAVFDSGKPSTVTSRYVGQLIEAVRGVHYAERTRGVLRRVNVLGDPTEPAQVRVASWGQLLPVRHQRPMNRYSSTCRRRAVP